MNDVSPELFLDAAQSFQKTTALKAAIGLDLFKAICAGEESVDTIAHTTGAAPRGVRILCDYLVTLGFLSKSKGRYMPTPVTSKFLDPASPACMASVIDFIAAPEMLSLWMNDPVANVRNGGSPGLAIISADNPIWEKFARAMVPFMRPLAAKIAARVVATPPAPMKVLDIAASHGLFGISVAQAVPGARVTAVDWAGVLRVAQENATAAGLADRYRPCPGSAFDVDWGGDYDLVLLPNFLHHFDRTTCVSLLRKVRASLAPRGRTLAVEFVPDEDRTSPPTAVLFAFMMLGSTPAGDAYTASEWDAMARDAGYAEAICEPLPPTPETLVSFEL
jgi:O-methyltransferase domain/Dimerisation domain